jgi:hypothetical protein
MANHYIRFPDAQSQYTIPARGIEKCAADCFVVQVFHGGVSLAARSPKICFGECSSLVG